MNSNLEQKHVRVRKIHAGIQEMALQDGKEVPCYYPGAARNAVAIDMAPLKIDILPDRFRCYAAKSSTMIGESLLERRGWTHVDVRLFGERRLSYNLSDDGELAIYLFKTGRWMRDYFGVDPAGDHTPILPGFFQDDKDPAWVQFKKSGLWKWPPEFPESHD